MFGEDVGRKGGVYGVTRGLREQARRRPGVRHAARRAVDPRPRARARGVAGCCRSRRSSTSPTCTTPRTSCAARRRRCSSSPTGQYRNPMVVRIAGYGYQKGFGGHFHNDNAVAVLRDIPGLVIASPARPDDAAAMLRTCVAAAAVDGSGLRLPRADRAVPHAGPARADGDRTGSRRTRPAGVGRRRTCRSAAARTLRRRRRPHASSRSATAYRCPCGSPRGWRATGIAVPGGRPALAGPAAGRRRAARRDDEQAGCWSSTRPGAPAGSPRGS